MAFSHIFFDCFNTLLMEQTDESGLCDIPGRLVTAGHFASREAFLQTYLTGVKALGANWTEVTLTQRLRYCLDHALAPVTDPEPVVQSLLRYWSDAYPAFLSPAPGVVEMLEYWRPRARLAVVSNFYESGIPAEYLRSHGLADYFDFVLDSAAFGHKKPSPLIYRHALQMAGLTPEDALNVLFIGDRLDLDIVPPLSLGFQVLHYSSRSGPSSHSYKSIAQWSDFR